MYQFPSQKVSSSAKNKAFFEKCAEAACMLLDYSTSTGARLSMKEKATNYDLADNILDPSDVETIVNPQKISGMEFPYSVRNYPLLKPKHDLLVGEETKRKLNYKVILTNSSAVSEKEQQQKEMFFEYIKSQILNPTDNEDTAKAKIEKIAEYMKYEMQDYREMLATEILAVQTRDLDLERKFNQGFSDALIASEEIYSISICSGKVVFKREHPLNVITFGSGNSQFIEDSQIIIFDGYRPLNSIIEDYNDELSKMPGIIDKLEEQSSYIKDPDKVPREALTIPENYYDDDETQNVIVVPSGMMSGSFTSGFNEEGNVREVRIFWKSFRKVGILSKIDAYGSEEIELVSDKYEPNELLGEQVEWIWVTEWLTATRLHDSIYVNCKHVPWIRASIDNPAVCIAPVVGTIYGNSLFSLGKTYQYLYNAVMHYTEMGILKSRGVIPRLPLHLVPDGWDIDQWIYYFEKTGYAVEDHFKEGKKGQAQGKLAGNFTGSTGPIDLSNSSYLQQNIAILNLIKNNLDEITGISPQRQGAIEQRELVHNVERSVTQSSLITSAWFELHDSTKVRALRAILEFTKYAWRDKKFKRQYVLSDMSQKILDYDSDAIADSEFGIFISNSGKDQELFQRAMSLGELAVQSGKASLSQGLSIFMSESMLEARRKIEAFEEKAQQAATAQVEQKKNEEIAGLTKKFEQQLDTANETIRDLEEQVKDNEEQLQVEREKMGVDKEIEKEKIAVSREELAEKTKDNAESRAIERKALTIKNKEKSTTKQ